MCGKNKVVKKQLEARSWPGVHVEARNHHRLGARARVRVRVRVRLGPIRTRTEP